MTVVYRGAEGYKPPVDRRVPAVGVRCPTCSAEAGKPCVATGERRVKGTVLSPGAYHKGRRRMAVRADNAARGI